MYGGRVRRGRHRSTTSSSARPPLHARACSARCPTSAAPRADGELPDLTTVPGLPPAPTDLPPGCVVLPALPARGATTGATTEQPPLREVGARPPGRAACDRAATWCTHERRRWCRPAGLEVHFPVRRPAAARRAAEARAGRGRRRPRHPPRRDARPGRRVRLRQVDAGQRAAAAGRRRPAGRSTFDGTDVTALRPAASCSDCAAGLAMVFQDPFASLDPRRTVAQTVAEPLEVHGLHAGAAARGPRLAELLGAGRASTRRSRGRLPARVLRRPAAAGRHRPGAGGGAGLPGLRRADRVARRLRAGAGAQPAAAAAARSSA